ncbi:hypothetical protein OUZ56_019940 [Daphnia magna]|uniref:Uncharacterized protein n=1 Tax=Daphnia magna TaxID=35525 RepID=A0ABQ9ZDT3_9CRUS|nr:hypothetical protein OUZ56_019940 [Daphnia magna]
MSHSHVGTSDDSKAFIELFAKLEFVLVIERISSLRLCLIVVVFTPASSFPSLPSPHRLSSLPHHRRLRLCLIVVVVFAGRLSRKNLKLRDDTFVSCY